MFTVSQSNQVQIMLMTGVALGIIAEGQTRKRAKTLNNDVMQITVTVFTAETMAARSASLGVMDYRKWPTEFNLHGHLGGKAKKGDLVLFVELERAHNNPNALSKVFAYAIVDDSPTQDSEGSVVYNNHKYQFSQKVKDYTPLDAPMPLTKSVLYRRDDGRCTIAMRGNVCAKTIRDVKFGLPLWTDIARLAGAISAPSANPALRATDEDLSNRKRPTV